MPQETLGYVEMEWTCRRCGTKNPGLKKQCQNCGAQMEAGQQFEKPAESALVTDAEKVAQAKKGADIHCPFCGTRNTADAKACVHCGGDLTKGQKREAGQVVGAYSAAPAAKVKCPACSTENAPSAANCVSCGKPLGNTAAAAPPMAAARPASRTPVSPLVLGLIALVATLCLCGLGFLILQAFNTTDLVGVVQAVRWERSLGLEARVPVERQAWADQLPAEATVGACESRPREMSSAPDPSRRSEKICGTPYTVDLGNGLSEVRQDCEYQIYDDYCPYAVLEWSEVDRVTARGADLNPFWPQVSVGDGQRQGRQREAYTVTFSTDGQSYDYTPNSAQEFVQFQPGSRWTLTVNGFGAVTGVSPAR
jgi:membrane protease subunit (stomatin/prohibitin family)